MIAAILFASLLPKSCEEEEVIDTGEPPEQLVIPPLDGVELDPLFRDVVQRGLYADGRVPWDGLESSIANSEAGCPDFYAGTPDEQIDGIDEDAKGTSWSDYCRGSTLSYNGWMYWESDAQAEGRQDTYEGRTVEAQRTLLGDGTVSQGATVRFEFDGTMQDALLRSDATGYTHWSYSSQTDATVSGVDGLDDGIIGEKGYRTDMYMMYTGGDVDSIEMRGNVYFFDPADYMAGRFDSIAMDIEFSGPLGITPDDCPTEPRGWIGVRDSDAYWYDVVFEPRRDDDATDSGYEPDPYTACDGCGTLYVRGVPQDVQVCPDLSFLWNGTTLVPPEPEEFVLSIRDTVEDP